MKILSVVMALLAASCAHTTTTVTVKAPVTSILTEPDYGTTHGHTLRWAGPRVTYALDGLWPDTYVATIREAFTFAANATGLEVVEIAPPANITVHRAESNGAYTQLWPKSDWTIARVTIDLGCCRSRPAWEDILQAFGPAGDHGPPGSLFTDDLTAQRASAFDACVLKVLYRYWPGATASDLEGESCES